MEYTILITTLVVALILVIEGIRGYRKSGTLQTFFLLEEPLTLGRFVGTLASSNFSLGNMIFLSLIWGYFYGLSGTLWLWIGFVLAAAAYMFFLSRFPVVQKYVADSTNSGSVHEYLQISFSRYPKDRTARWIRFAASLSTVLCLLIAITLEIYIAAYLLAPLVQVDVSIIFLALTALICMYSAFGGFYSVVVTDIIQGLLLLIAMGVLLIVVWYLDLPIASYSQIHDVTWKGFLFAPGWAGILSIVSVTVGWYLVTMDTWQRACSSRSVKVARSAVVYGTIIFAIAILLFTLLGVYDNLALSTALTENQAALFSDGYFPLADYYLFVDRLPGWGQALMGFVAVAFVMAGLSTADTFLIVCGHSFVSDLIVGVGRHATLGELEGRDSRLFMGFARVIIAVMGLLVMALFFFLGSLDLLRNPLALFYLAYSIQFSLLAPVIASLWRQKPGPLVILIALLTAVGVSVVWGFGFALAGRIGIESFAGMSVDEWIYLAPLPPMIVGFLVVGSWRALRYFRP